MVSFQLELSQKHFKDSISSSMCSKSGESARTTHLDDTVLETGYTKEMSTHSKDNNLDDLNSNAIESSRLREKAANWKHHKHFQQRFSQKATCHTALREGSSGLHWSRCPRSRWMYSLPEHQLRQCRSWWEDLVIQVDDSVQNFKCFDLPLLGDTYMNGKWQLTCTYRYLWTPWISSVPVKEQHASKKFPIKNSI